MANWFTAAIRMATNIDLPAVVVEAAQEHQIFERQQDQTLFIRAPLGCLDALNGLAAL